jgi:replicative DNA helicase
MMDVARMLPHNLEAEQSVLGSMLLGDDYAREGVSLLAADDFYRQAHQRIFTAIMAVLRKNGGVDLLSVFTELREQGVSDETGGAYYLNECTDAVPTAVNLDYHDRKVRSCAVDRLPRVHDRRRDPARRWGGNKKEEG